MSTENTEDNQPPFPKTLPCAPTVRPQWTLSREIKVGELISMAVGILVFLSFVYTTRTYKLSEANSRKQLRPWVGPEFPDRFIKLGKPNEPITVQFKIKNYGSLPALGVHTSVRIFDPSDRFNIHDIQSQIENLEINQQPAVLFSGQDEIVQEASTLNPFESASQIKGVEDRKYFLVVGGKISYVDDLQQEHQTTFCVLYAPTKPFTMQTFAGNSHLPSLKAGWVPCGIVPKVT